MFWYNQLSRRHIILKQRHNILLKYRPSKTEIRSLKYVVRIGFEKCQITPETTKLKYSFQPILYCMSMLNTKGCSYWTKKLKKFKTSYKTIHEMENNWNTSLGRVMGDNFLKACYKRVSELFFDNQIKIFFYHIVQGCLQTNRIIHNFVV